MLLTKKTANKKAFKGVGKKMVIKVPKKVKKAYVKIFKGLIPDGMGPFSVIV